MAAKVEPFWKRKTLAELDSAEWESLCDGCGLCCLQKLEDEEDGAVYYAHRLPLARSEDLSMQRLPQSARQRTGLHSAQCPGRRTVQRLPPTCAYRLVAERSDLPLWHHLVCGDREAVHVERISQAGRMLAEGSVAEEHWEDHLIFRAG